MEKVIESWRRLEKVGEAFRTSYHFLLKLCIPLHQVVVVTLNYRLGFLGFLKTEERGMGNFGLLDILAALHWIQVNLKEIREISPIFRKRTYFA